MRRAALALAAVIVCGAAAPVARAEDPVTLSASDLRRVRAILAWQRAVWRVGAEGFQRAVTGLELCRDDPATRSDITILYMLGVSYMRLGRASDAEPVLSDVRSLAPDFPGLALTDAMRVAARKPSNDAEARAVGDDALARYDAFLATTPEDGAFADEMRFMGLVLRGMLRARIAGHHDDALVDLTAARALAAAKGMAPSSDLASILAHVNQSLDQTEEAKRLIVEAMSRDPAESTHYANLGLVVAGTYDDGAARKWFEAALARRPDFPEAHLKLGYIASRAGQLSEMRAHLEAARSMFDRRVKAGTKTDTKIDAELASGFGTYWKLVGQQRIDEGDDAGGRAAFLEAEKHFREALRSEPGCKSALSILVLILDRLGGRDDEVRELKARIDDLNKLENRKVNPYRSTFC